MLIIKKLMPDPSFDYYWMEEVKILMTCQLDWVGGWKLIAYVN